MFYLISFLLLFVWPDMPYYPFKMFKTVACPLHFINKGLAILIIYHSVHSDRCLVSIMSAMSSLTIPAVGRLNQNK